MNMIVKKWGEKVGRFPPRLVVLAYPSYAKLAICRYIFLSNREGCRVDKLSQITLNTPLSYTLLKRENLNI